MDMLINKSMTTVGVRLDTTDTRHCLQPAGGDRKYQQIINYRINKKIKTNKLQ